MWTEKKKLLQVINNDSGGSGLDAAVSEVYFNWMAFPRQKKKKKKPHEGPFRFLFILDCDRVLSSSRRTMACGK